MIARETVGGTLLAAQCLALCGGDGRGEVECTTGVGKEGRREGLAAEGCGGETPRTA